MANATDFYMTTPGSAVAGALQDILTRRKTESHQAMLDKMAQEEQTSVIGARAEQQRIARENLDLQRQQEARQKLLNEAQMREMEQQGLEREMGHLAPGTKDTDIQDPNLQKYVEQTGGFRSMPESPDMPAVTGDVVQGANMEREYAGTPKEQAETAGRERASAIISQIQNEQDPQKRQALTFQLIQEGVDPRQIPEMLARQQLVTAGGKVIPIQNAPMVPASDANKFLGYPPNYGGTQSNSRSNFEITHPDGSQEVRSLTAEQAADEEKKGNTLVGTNKESLTNPVITPTDRAKLLAARTELEAARGDVGWWSGKPDPKQLAFAEAQYNQALTNIYNADVGITPHVKDLAIRIAMHPRLSKLTTQQLVTGSRSLLKGLATKDINDLDRLLSYTRGNPDATFAVEGQAPQGQ